LVAIPSPPLGAALNKRIGLSGLLPHSLRIKICTSGGMLASLRSAAVVGLDALPVVVEVDVSIGLPVFTMVGLPDTSVRESRDRVRSAIRNSGYHFPGHRVTVNLAPADVRKAGASYDLPIALGILAASGIIEQRRIDHVVLLGELSLDGSIQPIRGVLPVAVAARREGKSAMLLPRANAPEARVVEGLMVLPVDSLAEAVHVLNRPLNEAAGDLADRTAGDISAVAGPAFSITAATDPQPDFADVAGQAMAKRALEVAAAGGHNILLVGPPGGGNTMMARRLPSVLPPLEFDEALDCTAVHSVAGTLPPGAALMHVRPFRAPHHTISEVAMVGGGSNPRPGEISLAHNGVLFLDELPEFERRVLEALRQPLEEGRVTVARSARTASFPARFMLVAAMNPCPCGFHGDNRRACRCSPPQIHRYAGRISGPLRDRIDLLVDVTAAGAGVSGAPREESSATIRARVIRARGVQRRRFVASGSRLNAGMEGVMLREHCSLDRAAAKLLEAAIQKFCLSARGCDRVLRISRTIADLEESPQLNSGHLAEALQYRVVFA
jgi:magnesium chelatase family protein